MTIEQVEELRVQEMEGTLRMPKLLIDENDIEKAHGIRWAIFSMLKSEKFFQKLTCKSILRKLGVEISGNGSGKKKYILKTPFGEGECFKVEYLFKGKNNPLEVGKCFSNSFNMASAMVQLPDIETCDCVSGILYTKGDNCKSNILHSVFELKGYVVDVNFGLCISKELYYKIFMFEELVRLSGQQINEAKEILSQPESREIAAGFNLKSYHLVFALDDFIDFLTNKERQNNHENFSELNYRY